MKTCTSCKIEKPLPEFCAQPRGKFGRTASCKECRSKTANAWNKENKGRYRNNELLRKYGMAREKYDTLLVAQGGVCAICKDPCALGRELAVDHNHKTKENRGLLCFNCNTGLGKFLDCPTILQRAMEYLCSYMTVPKV